MGPGTQRCSIDEAATHISCRPTCAPISLICEKSLDALMLCEFWGPEATASTALLGLPRPSWDPIREPDTHLHMLDFRELELLGDEGGVWYDQL